MSFLAPVFLAITALALAGLVIAHLFSRSRPRDVILPTARFVPDGAAQAPTRARLPTDLVLLAVRAMTIALIGLAFAQPVVDGARRDVVRVFLVDESWHVADDPELRRAHVDAVRALFREGDSILAFDSVVRAVASPDSLRANEAGRAPGSLSLALVAGMRLATQIARSADSIELVIVSPVAGREVDSATLAIRAEWPGRVRLIRTVATPAPMRAEIEIRAPADDPVRAATALLGGATDATVRIVRDGVTGADSAWAAQDGRVLVVWLRDEAPGQRTGALRTDSIGAVIAGGRVVAAPFERLTSVTPPAVRVVARWVDGAPAATEIPLGEGCMRTVSIALPTASDVALRAEFGLFLRELLGPCGGRRLLTPASDLVIARLAGEGPLATGRELQRSRDSESRVAAWLLAAALVLAVLEHLLRRRQRSAPLRDDPMPRRGDALSTARPARSVA